MHGCTRTCKFNMTCRPARVTLAFSFSPFLHRENETTGWVSEHIIASLFPLKWTATSTRNHYLFALRNRRNLGLGEVGRAITNIHVKRERNVGLFSAKSGAKKESGDDIITDTVYNKCSGRCARKERKRIKDPSHVSNAERKI